MLSIQRQIRNTFPIMASNNVYLQKKVLFMGFQPGYKFSTESDVLWDGNTLRTGNHGFSGTHQSIVAMAELMAAEGYNVYISFRTCRPKSIVNGVTYITTEMIPSIEKDVIVIVAPSWIDPTVGFRWVSLQKYVIWTHTKELFPNEALLKTFWMKYPACKIYLNTITNFVQRFLDTKYSYHKKYVYRVGNVHNPMLLDMIQPVTQKNPESFIFHSSFERGGALACRVFDTLNLPQKTMEICSYNPEDLELSEKYIISTKNKKEVFELLAKTEYFIYPGVSSKDYRLYKETDSLVVAECLLHEVIVLAFKVGALYENYGDCVAWIPFPDETNLEYINQLRDTFHPELMSEEVVNSICKIIYDLEANPSKKEELKKKGKDHVQKQRNPKIIKEKFFKLLDI